MYDGDTFEHNGNRFRVAFLSDDTMGAPWDEHDGHGPVTKAPLRANYRGYISKAPGQRFLGEHWLYNFAEAVRMAKRDGWRALEDVGRADMTRGQLAARAAEEDFQRLKDWCEGRWCWIGVVVTLLDDDGDATDETASLWGIESDAGDFLEEVARELADEITANLKAAASV